ncbi:MAG: hypothetical protein LBM25_02285 [Bacteroidales bacterium]|jgi:hypothetical protein|nr:hypothetical protein [Bacteroidales bacterium]
MDTNQLSEITPIRLSYLNSITTKDVVFKTMDEVVVRIQTKSLKYSHLTESEVIQEYKKLKQKHQLPVVCFSVELVGGHKKECIQKYNNLLVCDVDHLPTEEEAKRVKERISKDPFCLLAMISPSQLGVKFIIKLPKLLSPISILNQRGNSKRFEELDNFHKAWFQVISSYIFKKYYIQLDPSGSNVNRLCFLPYDKDVYYNPTCQEFCLEETKDKILRTYLHISAKKPNIIGNRNNAAFLLTEQCRTNGYAIKDVREFLCTYFSLPTDEIDTIVKNSRKKTSTKNNGEKHTRDRDVTNKKIQDLFEEKAIIHFNTVKQCYEVSLKGSGIFEQLDEPIRNSIYKYITNTYPTVPKYKIFYLLETDECEQFNPFRAYFNSLPSWDGEDYLKEVTDKIPVKYNDIFYLDLKKWLVGFVASVMEDEVCNQFCFVLAGKEGRGKSKFFKKLVPKSLVNDYYVNNNLEFYNKDLSEKVERCCIINVDELDKLCYKDFSQLKSILSIDSISDRPAYGKYQRKYIRNASFCATTNQYHFLTGEQGERRFYVHEITGFIPQDLTIDHEKLYSQIFHLYNEGFHSWEEEEEIERRAEYNEEFSLASQEEELIKKFFFVPTQEDMNCGNFEKMTTTEIRNHIENYLGNTKIVLRPNKISQILREMEFPRKKNNDHRFWCVKRKDSINL